MAATGQIAAVRTERDHRWSKAALQAAAIQVGERLDQRETGLENFGLVVERAGQDQAQLLNAVEDQV